MLRINFVGLPLVTGDFLPVADWLTSLASLDTKHPFVVTHINVNNYYILCKNKQLCRHLQENAHLLLDGIGMKIAAFWMGLDWVPDVNGTDLFPLVMAKLVNKDIPIYFLGGNEVVVKRTVQNVRSMWPNIRIVGYNSGYFSETDEEKVVEAINESGARVLLVGRGFPLQEKFSLRFKKQLKVSLIWNVGGYLTLYLALSHAPHSGCVSGV